MPPIQHLLRVWVKSQLNDPDIGGGKRIPNLVMQPELYQALPERLSYSLQLLTSTEYR